MTEAAPVVAKRWTRWLLAANVLATGGMFGTMQWCIFFFLQSYMASTAIVYLLGGSAWLLGSVLGLALPDDRMELAWLVGALGVYFAMGTLAATFPFRLALLPILLLAVAGAGCYAGRFFRYRAGTFRRAKWLFFIENTGFVAGVVLTVAALCAWGAWALWALPAVAGLVVIGTWWPLGALATAGSEEVA